MKVVGIFVVFLLFSYFPPSISDAYEISTQDGLTLYIDKEDPSIQYITIDGISVSKEKQPAGFMLLDIEKENLRNVSIADFSSFKGQLKMENNKIMQQANQFDFHLKAFYIAYPNYIKIEGKLTNLADRERAIVFAYSLPFDAINGIWWDDIRNYRNIEEKKIYRGNIFYSPHFHKFSLRYNEYPFSALNINTIGLSFAIRLDNPAIFRIEYDSNVHRYYITFDFGFSNLSTANFSFIIYRINEWSFRCAAHRYYQFYLQFFERRANKYGNCAPHVHYVYCWKDENKMRNFHFAYDLPFPKYLNEHSVEELIKTNKKLGIDTLVFSIGGISYGIRMEREEFEKYFKRGQRKILNEEDVYEALTIFKEKLEKEENKIKEMPPDKQFEARLNSSIIAANATRIFNNGCGFYQNDGDAVITPEDVSYFTGIQIFVNHNPKIPDRSKKYPYTNFAHMLLYYRDDFGLRFNGKRVGAITFLDKWEEKGICIDGIVADYLFIIGEDKIKGDDFLYNHNREHFKYTDLPLTFDYRNKKPAIYNPFSFWEFIKFTSEELHNRNKLLAGGDVSSVNSFFFPYIDILTTEIGTTTVYDALNDEYANSLRTFAYHKPFYIFYNRQGSSYKEMSKEEVEYYIQNCLFYGLYPSFHVSHYGNLSNPKSDSYWANKKLCKRDEHLWAIYMPIIIELDKAGWEPITYAKADNVEIERFGKEYFTIRNFYDSYKKYELVIEADKLNLSDNIKIKELISDKFVKYEYRDGKIIIKGGIKGKATKVFKIYKGNSLIYVFNRKIYPYKKTIAFPKNIHEFLYHLLTLDEKPMLVNYFVGKQQCNRLTLLKLLHYFQLLKLQEPL